MIVASERHVSVYQIPENLCQPPKLVKQSPKLPYTILTGALSSWHDKLILGTDLGIVGFDLPSLKTTTK